MLWELLFRMICLCSYGLSFFFFHLFLFNFRKFGYLLNNEQNLCDGLVRGGSSRWTFVEVGRYRQDRTLPRRSRCRSIRYFYWWRRPPTKSQIRSSIPSPLRCSCQKRSRPKPPSRCSRWTVQWDICSRRPGDGSSRCYIRWSAVPEEPWSGVGDGWRTWSWNTCCAPNRVGV